MYIKVVDANMKIVITKETWVRTVGWGKQKKS